MGLVITGEMQGRNSHYLRNSPLGPAKLSVIAYQGVKPTSVSFDIAGIDGQFTDNVSATYNPNASGPLGRWVLNEGAKKASMFFKGELTTRYDGVSPKRIAFDIIYRADRDFTPGAIIERVKILQSFCYPRRIIKGNPPLCVLQVLHLYCLEVYVEQVQVSWHNTWNLMTEQSGGQEKDHGLPMGCNIHVQCLMHQYPTRDEILEGAGFDSTRFVGNGYAGSVGQDGTIRWTHGDEGVRNQMRDNDAATAGAPSQAAAERLRLRNAQGPVRNPTIPDALNPP